MARIPPWTRSPGTVKSSLTVLEMNRDLGTTVLVSSHNLNSISDICDRILLLEKGNLIMDKSHVPGNMDQELEAYFLDAVK